MLTKTITLRKCSMRSKRKRKRSIMRRSATMHSSTKCILCCDRNTIRSSRECTSTRLFTSLRWPNSRNASRHTQRTLCTVGRCACCLAAGEVSLTNGSSKESIRRLLNMRGLNAIKNSHNGIRRLTLLKCIWHSFKRKSALRCKRERS